MYLLITFILMRKPDHYLFATQIDWDIIIIGGGATGLGIAVDAANRGLRTLLVEQADFAKGTSSRSTKLVHGGVRYLAQGDIGLVKHALRERGLLAKNAAHLVHKEEFIIPCYSWWSILKYGIGLTLYDWLAGKLSFGKSRYRPQKEISALMPGIKSKGLKGGISYFDGKFDDARLAINLMQTAQEQGAMLINYMQVTRLLKNGDTVCGVEVKDALSDGRYNFGAKCVINATGIFVDDILKLNNPNAAQMVRPSQGVHLVLKREFLNSSYALMIPKTSDKRVLFAVPWHEHLLIGTTDTPIEEHSLEPRALQQEIDFILNNASAYFENEPTTSDILSVFSGLRPLAAPAKAGKNSTKEISRDHKLVVSAKGLLTITGGKWTTYRKMAEDTVNLAIGEMGLAPRPCATQHLPIHGNSQATGNDYLNTYGTDRKHIEDLCLQRPALLALLHPSFPYMAAEVIWAVRSEMVLTVEDVLSRRLRVLFIDAKAAIEMSTLVAGLMAAELGLDKKWEADQIEKFNKLANGYVYQGQ